MNLSEIEFRETSQNFNSFRSFRQLLFSIFLSVVWLNWNVVRFHEVLLWTDAKSLISYLGKQKKRFLIIFFSIRCQYQNKKALFTDLIFSEGFDFGQQGSQFWETRGFRWRYSRISYIAQCAGAGCYQKNVNLLVRLFLDGSQTKFLYWPKLVFRVTRLQLPAGLVIPVNQVISWLSHL